MAGHPAPPLPTGRVQGQSWSSGAKDAITTSLTAHVWATVGQGIVNEVFWPAVDQPQVKDLGFLVRTAAGPQWREVKAVGEYTVRAADDPAVPLVAVTHTGDFYRLRFEVLPSPDHDALLLPYDLTGLPDGAGQELRLYPLLAPHLGRSHAGAGDRLGMDNRAWVADGALFATDPDGAHVLCLLAESGFARTSAGWVGDSDGWTDLFLHDGMRWEYTEAGPGVVALMGELVAPEGAAAGCLALGFGRSADQARAQAQGALDAGADATRDAVTGQWQSWAATLTLPGTADGLTEPLAAAVRQSATVLHANEDRRSPGGLVAGLATPWGAETNDPGGYHMVWGRDSCESALALAALGDLDTGARLLDFLADKQNPDGSWARCFFLDGSALPGLQLDETALPVVLAAKLTELGGALPASAPEMVRRAVRYLVRSGPASGEDRWEETQGTSPFSMALIVVALVAAAGTLDEPDRSYVLSLADNWNERIEDFSYVRGGVVDRAFRTTGHYVRIGPPADRVRLGNQPQETAVSAELMVGLEFLYLARLGLRDPRDPRITDTLKIVDRMLLRRTPTGQAFCRYDMDGYGEWIDGSGWPVHGFGVGRPWPLLVGERGHHDVLVGRDPAPRLEAMLAMRGTGGLLPEQVWDAGDLPWRHLIHGRPTGSAMPLAWAHSELVKLAVAATTGAGRPVERLTAVADRYPDQQPRRTTTWYWRDNGPVQHLPAGCGLVVEDTRPFTLHFAFDGWQEGTLAERRADASPFGMYAVPLTAEQLAGHADLRFTRRRDDGSWEGTDHTVLLGVPVTTPRALTVPPAQYAGRLPYPARRTQAGKSRRGARPAGPRA